MGQLGVIELLIVLAISLACLALPVVAFVLGWVIRGSREAKKAKKANIAQIREEETGQ